MNTPKAQFQTDALPKTPKLKPALQRAEGVRSQILRSVVAFTPKD
jgi:hypothetical protein